MRRNLALDYLKLILSFMVITIHVGSLHRDDNLFPYLLYNGLSRMAVPMFFIINGFFLSKSITDDIRFKQYVKRILLMYFVWTIIYLPFFIHEHKIFIPILNGYHHLWYLSSLIQAAILLWLLLKKITNLNILVFLSILLFSIGYLLQKYNIIYPTSHIGIILKTTFLTRNSLFIGFPFLFCGYYLSAKFEALKTKSNQKLLFLLILSFIILFVEAYFDYKLDVQKSSDFFFSFLLICPILLILFLRRPLISIKNDFISKLSTAIYLVHPLLIPTCNKMFPSYGFGFLAFVVIISSVLASLIILQINKWVKILLV